MQQYLLKKYFATIVTARFMNLKIMNWNIVDHKTGVPRILKEGSYEPTTTGITIPGITDGGKSP